MRPPICAVCNRDSRDESGLTFKLVTFANYEPIDQAGHPQGLEWFCADHLEAAQRLHHLSDGEAIQQIRSKER